jgi:hypothetical protein
MAGAAVVVAAVPALGRDIVLLEVTPPAIAIAGVVGSVGALLVTVAARLTGRPGADQDA